MRKRKVHRKKKLVSDFSDKLFEAVTDAISAFAVEASSERFSYRSFKADLDNFYSLAGSTRDYEMLVKGLNTLFYKYGVASSYRTRAGFHPSSFRKDCSRKIWYDQQAESLYETPFYLPDPTGLMIMLSGSFWHHFIQVALDKAGILEQWEVAINKDDNPYQVQGHSDGIVNDRILLEIKSSNPFSINKLDTPEDGHWYQATVYAKVLGLEKILFIYIDRGFCQLKPILVEPLEVYWKEFLDKREDVLTPTAPSRVCINEFSEQAMYCPYRKECFNLK